MNLNPKAQTLAEYAIVFSLVFAAIIGMQLYVKRGLQAKFKDFVVGATKNISNSAGLKQPLTQYEPYYIDSEITTQQSQNLSTTYNPGGTLRRNWKDGENVIIRTGTTTTTTIKSE